jgi:penicillin-binding protein 2
MTTQHIGTDDRRSVQLRLSVMQYLLAGVFSLLAVAFWVFQVAQHAQFKEIAESQYLQRVPLPAPRGVVFDRNGTVLVANQDSFNIVLLRERTKDVDGTLQTLAAATGEDLNAMREIVERRKREPAYRPIVLIENATEAQVMAVAARSLELPGVEHQPFPTRRYDGGIAAHLFGYVGEINEAQLQRDEFKALNAGAIIGQAGFEQAYNALLMGTEGAKDVVVNSRGREIRVVAEQDAQVGTAVHLTIDADLQKAAEDGFRHFGIARTGEPYNGAAVVLDPRSGEVLTFVSLPAYDPNKFAVGIDRASWQSYNTDRLKPLHNRALQGIYSPGSTFKIVVAAAALEEGLVTPDHRITCTGGKFFYNRTFQCHKAGGHGSLNLRQAIEQSCNVYFYTLGQMLGVDRIHKWATALGLGQINGIDLPNEAAGLIPSTEWKQRVRKEPWYPGETISVAIGQGQVDVTPLSLAVMMMTVANGGTRHTPHVLKAIERNGVFEPVEPPAPRSVVRMKDATVRALHDGLWMAVNAAGTAGRARVEGFDVSGKTGTAQVISLGAARAAAERGQEVRHHGWFVFFAPRDNPEIAGVIFAEHAGRSGESLPIARHIIETYLAKKEGRALPVLEPAETSNAVATTDAAGPRPAGGTH